MIGDNLSTVSCQQSVCLVTLRPEMVETFGSSATEVAAPRNQANSMDLILMVLLWVGYCLRHGFN